VAATQTYGTSRVNALTLFAQALNQQVPTVYDVDPRDRDKRIVNQAETLTAREKQQELKAKFVEWLWSDEARALRLARIYNDGFNNRVERKYDGSHLVLPGFSNCVTLGAHQRNAIWRTVVSGTNTLLAHAVGAGKAQPLDAKVLTPEGWTLMGALKVGDSVITVDGEATAVTGVFPQGRKAIYKVTFSDGSSTECCDEHLWLTWSYRERSQAQRAKKLGKEWLCGRPKVRSLSEIRRTLRSGHLNALNHSIPIVSPVHFAAQNVPVDPYLLGVLLGDGTITGKFTQLTSADEDIVRHCQSRLGDNLELVKLKAPYQWGFRSQKVVGFGKEKQPNPLRKALTGLGVQGTDCYTKFIPDVYKFNTVDVRVALLQGLMDTDGSVQRRSVYFHTSSPRLAEDVKFLVQSLGGTVLMTTKRPKFRHNGEERIGALSYNLCLKLPNEIMPFRLRRKREAVKAKSSYLPVRYIVDVVAIDEREAQCISVDHPSRLYVTDDFIVTHNTYEMICAGMELRRLGKARKPCHLVPNHILEQYTAEFLRAYPSAKVLMATKDDLSGDRRRTMLSRIATGDWDAVIITHSSFERIPLSTAYMEQFIGEELERIEEALRQLRSAIRGNRIVKELARAKKQWQAKLLKLSRKDKKDDILTFEDLGIDWLFTDESHFFKNLYRLSKMTRIAGLPNSNSERAFDLFVKTRHVMEHRADECGIVFATATPIANSMAELWVVQRYLQPRTLERYMVDSFDTWAGSFGESVTALEVAPDGSGYRMHTRFSRFVNLPELMTMFREVADIQTKEDLNLPTPKVLSETVTAKASPVLKSFVKTLVKRAELIRSGQVTPQVDNMLAVTNDGRKAALDMRLVGPMAGDDPEGKVTLCANTVYRIWESTAESRGTQILFCDLSTPANDGRFNVYSDLKQKLVSRGVLAAEIAFIHDYESDAAKAKLFKAVREGRIRVLLGSTGKMGVGTNVQTRLVALHHLDAPWRPADIEQREGRIERQGNLNTEVNVTRLSHQFLRMSV